MLLFVLSVYCFKTYFSCHCIQKVDQNFCVSRQGLNILIFDIAFSSVCDTMGCFQVGKFSLSTCGLYSWTPFLVMQAIDGAGTENGEQRKFKYYGLTEDRPGWPLRTHFDVGTRVPLACWCCSWWLLSSVPLSRCFPALSTSGHVWKSLFAQHTGVNKSKHRGIWIELSENLLCCLRVP